MATPALKVSACSAKTPLDARPLLSMAQSSELARLFEVLASGTRLRLLHALVLLDDPCMSDLADAVGMKPQAVSNQLRRLVDLGILSTRRHGVHIHYKIVDSCMTKLMYHGLCLNQEAQSHARVTSS